MKKFFNAALIVLLFSIYFAMPGAQAQTQFDVPADKAKVGALKYKEVGFNVWLGEIMPGENGKTTVELLTDIKITVSDLDTNLIMSAIYEMLQVQMKANNATFDFYTFSVKAGGIQIAIGDTGRMEASVSNIVYEFDTKAMPDKIIVSTKDGHSVTFDGKTKNIAK